MLRGIVTFHEFPWDHTAGQWQCWGLNLSALTPKPVLIPVVIERFLTRHTETDESPEIDKILGARVLFWTQSHLPRWAVVMEGLLSRLGDAGLKYLGPSGWRCSQVASGRFFTLSITGVPDPQVQSAECCRTKVSS